MYNLTMSDRTPNIEIPRDPITLEVARYLATFRDVRYLIQQGVELQNRLGFVTNDVAKLERVIAQSIVAMEASARRLEQTADAARHSSDWDTRKESLSLAMEINICATIESYVDDTLEQIRILADKLKLENDETMRKWLERMTYQQGLLDRTIVDLSAAAMGKPPVPVAPHSSTPFVHIVFAFRAALAHFRRWCIDMLAPVTVIGLPALVTIGVCILAVQLTNIFHQQ